MSFTQLKIGRDASCDIILNDNSISRRHAEIFIDEEGNSFITDLSSKNGTFVNGQRIFESVLISVDDVVTCGNQVVVHWQHFARIRKTNAPYPAQKELDFKIMPYFLVAGITALCFVIIQFGISKPEKKDNTISITDVTEILTKDPDKPIDKRKEEENSTKRDPEEGKSKVGKTKIDASCLKEEGDYGTTDLILIGEEIDREITNTVGREVTREEEEQEGKNLLRDCRRTYKFVESGKKFENLKFILSNLVKELKNPRGFNYQIYFIESEEWNAFTCGGQIFVTTTIYDYTKTSDEMACIIAHEIYHNELYHINEMLKKSSIPGAGVYSQITRSFGQKKETYCDLNGIDLAVAAGYEGCAAHELWQRMSEERDENGTVLDKFFNSHPYSKNRSKCSKSHMEINYGKICNNK
jgi:hypothetical protein